MTFDVPSIRTADLPLICEILEYKLTAEVLGTMNPTLKDGSNCGKALPPQL